MLLTNSKQRVLIVDDEPRNQRIVAEILGEIAELGIVSSGEEALHALENGVWDLVLLDIMMPGINGYEVCRKIREDLGLAPVKVILISGKALVEERLKGYEVGADEYITKPFVPEELLAKAKVFLRLAVLEREMLATNRNLDEKVRERTRQLMDAKARLVTSAKMSALGEMAGGMAHEINTPLTIIGMSAVHLQEAIKKEPLDRERIAKVARTIHDTARRINAIINGLRMFSRDGSKDHFENTQVKSIISSTLSLCSEKMKHDGVALEIDDIPEEWAIQCRSVQVSQVLLNLISNACDAIAALPEKWVRITATRLDGSVRIRVTDSGKGISESVREKAFEPFFTTKDVGKGTGLGLSVSKGIVDSHQGTLTIDDRCENTSFVLTLPERQDHRASDTAEGETA